MRASPVSPLCNHLRMVFIICIGKLFILLNPLLQFLKGGEFLFRAVEGQELDFYIFTVDVAFQAKDLGLHACGVFSSYRGLFADIGDACIVDAVHQHP